LLVFISLIRSWLIYQSSPAHITHPPDYKADSLADAPMQKATYLNSGRRILGYEARLIERNVQEPNRGYLFKYADFLSLNNRKERTLAKRLNELRAVCGLGVCKDFKKLEKEDVEEIVRRVNVMEVRNSKHQSLHRPLCGYSKARIKLTFKQFIKWLKGSDELVSWIKLDRVSATLKLPEELLTEEDVERLLTACRTQRDTALIALLWDSGARIGEALNCKVKDVVFSSESANYVILDGKTGRRRTPLSVSVPYLSRYINARKNCGKEDPLFVSIEHNQFSKISMEYSTVRKVFGELRARAKVEKRIHPHVFRYSRCSYLSALGMPNEAMKLFFGWSNLKMISHYSRLSGAQVDEAFYRSLGMKESGEVMRPKLNTKSCFKCHELCEATAKHCNNCGSRLDKTPFDEISEIEDMKQRLEFQEGAIEKLKDMLDELGKLPDEEGRVVEAVQRARRPIRELQNVTCK